MVRNIGRRRGGGTADGRKLGWLIFSPGFDHRGEDPLASLGMK
jgi:hypothetical protein